MNRGRFIHETAIRAAAAMAMAGTVEPEGFRILPPAAIASRAKAIALALAEALDMDHPEGGDVLEDEPWRGR
jgi:hypothetical protein